MAERSPRDPRDPLDEEAAWAEIVAGYGEQPEFPTGGDDADEKANGEADEKRAGGGDGEGHKGDQSGKDSEQAEGGAGPKADGDTKPDAASDSGTGDASRPGSFIVYAPGVGPRDWSAAEPSDDDFDEADEGHFTPPEPPPLPQADVTAKFAWIAVLGGPLLLVVMALLQQPVTWWITLLGIGGFLGGFATLVARMKNDDEDDDGTPGSGAVV
ncbi:hypothetical protein [Streptomyces halobius]|uniref:DUF308 domain-containing protein n=1 Tax=Streptomyces halobius TaxID=2879846 RepID=A0ABY4MDV9_9ACTN|nr:hypothetical protein [Streptomyces halobius]UQA95959.1 hypothetical protein K9S39_32445 [Streptomyces halobius]